MMQAELTSTTPTARAIEYPTIAPVSPESDRPLWSVMIPTYNRVKYLEQTLKSVLEQAPNLNIMQIEVIDNCSTENDPETFVKKIGEGRISFYRQSQNVGFVGNFNTCIQRSKGHLVHILHDDDVVLPGFYSRLQSAFEKEPTIGAAFCRYAHVNEFDRQQYLAPIENSTPGILPNWLEQIAVDQKVQPPAIVVRRSVYEACGGFHPGLSHAVDWEMWMRIAAHYSVWYEPEMLALYRVHSASDTSEVIRSGKNIVDAMKVIEIAQSYLPTALAPQLSQKARENCAVWALVIARRALSRGDTKTAIVQIKAALQCSKSPKAIGSLAVLPILAGMGTIKQYVRA